MKQVRSIVRTLQILESFPAGRSRSAGEIAGALKIPKSTVHDILSTLAAHGVLVRENGSGRFQLGTLLIELGNRARRNFPLNRVAAPYLSALCEAFDETVYLTVRDRDEVFYADCFESTRSLRTFAALGDRAPLYCTAVGKAILAFLPAEEIRRVLGRNRLVRYTANTITDPQRLLRELRRTAERGYSVDDAEHEEGVRCVGAPVRDGRGRVFAAVSVSGPAQRVSPEREPQIAARVREAAREISRGLGYRPEEPERG